MVKKTKNKFLSNILIISSGTAFAQLLNILLSPLITRLYTPEEYGAIAIFSVFIGLLAVSTFKFEEAIPVAESDREAIILFISSIIISCIINVLILIMLILMGDLVISLLNFNSYPAIIYMIPLGGLLIALRIIARQWTIRKSLYKNLTKSTLLQSILGNISKITFGIFGFGAIGLASARIISGSSGFWVLSRSATDDIKKYIKHLTVKDIFKTLDKYKSFAIYMIPNSILMIFVAQFPIIVIGFLYSPEITGYYSLANTIIMLPLAFLGDAIGDVFYSESARIVNKNPKKILLLSRKLAFILFLFSIIPALILLLFGPMLFKLVFGEPWYYAGVISQILSLVLITKLTFHPMIKIFEIIKRPKDKLVLNVTQLILLSIVFLLGLLLNIESTTFIIIYSIITSFMNILIFIWSQIILKRYIANSIDIVNNRDI